VHSAYHADSAIGRKGAIHNWAGPNHLPSRSLREVLKWVAPIASRPTCILEKRGLAPS
jgi:hypothetical protein